MKQIEKNDQKNISSAEMTAYWRCLYPKMSGDDLSIKLASPDGIAKAKAFEEKFSYPKIGRHVSTRAGFFLNQASELLLKGNYDSCISLGSGFSLLTYYIAKTIHKEKPTVKFIDVDLPNILETRIKRIRSSLSNSLEMSIFDKIETLALDLEIAYKENKPFDSLFPDYNSPLFVIEGIIYFLSNECVQWIYKGIEEKKLSAIIFDYWPEDGPQNSACFKRVVESIKGFMPENVKSFLTPKELSKLCRNRLLKDLGLQETEREFSLKIDENPQLTDQDEIILARFAVAGKIA